ncbi:MAG: hypothetical protein MZV70_06615 [Desulfobacterales bacterium]|nr:hypothetical protein [Desulfobacterales bacterium]
MDTVFVCNPNNPTGAPHPGRACCSRSAAAHPGVRFVVDESYLPFATRRRNGRASSAAAWRT